MRGTLDAWPTRRSAAGALGSSPLRLPAVPRPCHPARPPSNCLADAPVIL